MKAFWFAAVLLMGWAVVCVGQSTATEQPPTIPMPADRAAESYAIYSALMPIGETAAKGWPHELWLVRDATVTAVQPNQPCKPVSTQGATLPTMNPHVAVHAPLDQQKDFDEILEDFDAHCHDILALDGTLFQTTTPVHLLTPAEQQEFRDDRSTRTPSPELAERFAGASALYGFSEVYFNRGRTIALVYATHWCGNLCGQGIWFALRLRDGQWKQLEWNAANWIS